jgi:hypothetical protein
MGIRAKARTASRYAKPSGLALSNPATKPGFSPWGMLSFDAHNPPKAKHIRHHNLDLPATSPLPAHSQRQTLHRNSVPPSRQKPLPAPRLRGHARSRSRLNHARHRPINSKMRSIHQRWLLLRIPSTIHKRNLAQRLSRAPHKRRRRLQKSAHLHREQSSTQTIRRLSARTHQISRPHRSHPKPPASIMSYAALLHLSALDVFVVPRPARKIRACLFVAIGQIHSNCANRFACRCRCFQVHQIHLCLPLLLLLDTPRPSHLCLPLLLGTPSHLCLPLLLGTPSLQAWPSQGRHKVGL